MFNSLVSALISGGSIVTYDGSPTHPSPDVLWQLTADAKATAFGASPTFVQGMQKLGIKPKDKFDLSSVNFILCTGSPAQPETYVWFYDEVKKDLWMTSPSGGTDICSAIVGQSPFLPVRAGEIQCPILGIDAKAFDEAGKPVVNQIGELVIASPAPCMPIKFWNDPDGKRYYESYFADYPGIWRHGDYIKFKDDGSSVIYGRSDSTLNRHGVRIGTSEIYRCVEQIPEVADSLVVCLERRPGLYYMPLFVKLKPGITLDAQLSERIKDTLRRVCSPRHVPDEIHQVPSIPYTLSGKKMEIPVRKILEGNRRRRCCEQGLDGRSQRPRPLRRAQRITEIANRRTRLSSSHQRPAANAAPNKKAASISMPLHPEVSLSAKFIPRHAPSPTRP